MFIYPALDNSILIIQKKLKINNNSGVKCFPAIILKSNKQKNSNNKKNITVVILKSNGKTRIIVQFI